MEKTTQYLKLSAEIRRLQDEKSISVYPTQEQRIDWAHGNAAIENEAVTREIVERVALGCPPSKR